MNSVLSGMLTFMTDQAIGNPSQAEMATRVLNHLPWVVLQVDSTLRIQYANRMAATLFTRQVPSGVGHSLKALLNPGVFDLIQKRVQGIVARRSASIDLAVQVRETKNWLNLSFIPDLDSAGNVTGFLLLGRDVTERRRETQSRDERLMRLEVIRRIAMRQKPEMGVRQLLGLAVTELSQMLRNCTVASCTLMPDERVLFTQCHQGLIGPDLLYFDLDLGGREMLVKQLKQMRRSACSDVVSDPLFGNLAGMLLSRQIGSLLLEPVTFFQDSVHFIALALTSSHTWTAHEVETLREVRDYLNVAMLQSKAWQKVQDESRELTKQASRDFLTGLPNRRMFIERLNEALVRARRANSYFAVFIIDLDDFKSINDRFGHQAGDAVLRELGSTFRKAIRAGDIVARIGGDEFSVLADAISDPKDTATIMAKVVEGARREFEFESGKTKVNISGGIAIYPFDGEDSTSLLKSADQALYAAKRKGKNRFQHFSTAIGAQADQRARMKKGLEKAIQENEFVLHYQPIYDLKKCSITAVEALIRWQQPGKELAFPLTFLPLVDDLGLGGDVLNWVLHTACAEASRWNRETGLACRVSVNLGDRELASEAFVGQTERALSESQFSPNLLMLEATELGLMQVDEMVSGSLQELSEIGVTLSIDDFGTGYSSLDQLARIPFYAVKIAQDLVKRLPSDLSALRVLKTAVNIAKTLGVNVIAEGVETKEQLALISQEGCDSCQGRLISAPLPASQIPKLLRQFQLGS